MGRMVQTGIAKVVIIDSGVGALSILSEIDKLPLAIQIDLILDNGGFPYGEKEDKWLVQRSLSLLESYCTKNRVDAIVVACNTLSTICLPALREKMSTPIVGVVPAIKTAAQLSRSKHIALLATPATVGREYSNKLIQEFASDCVVLRHGSVNLVKAAEQKIWTQKSDLKVIAEETKFLDKDKLVDVVVLGCTHFPFLKQEFEQVQAQRKISWIDSSEAIARRIGVVLSEASYGPGKQEQLKRRLYFTQSPEDAGRYKASLAFARIDEIHLLA